jgi:hypothetical protein
LPRCAPRDMKSRSRSSGSTHCLPRRKVG